MLAVLLPTLAIFAAFFTHEASAIAATLTLNGKSVPRMYNYGESISITFVNNKTSSNGAIAIFPITNPQTTTSKTFVRTCGTVSCTNAVASGTVVFSSAVQAIQWPLPAGSYFVMLIDSAGYPQTERYTFTVGVAPPAPPSPSLTFVNHATASYAYNESLVFGFTNPQPTSGDFIGIWTAAAWASNPKPSTSTFVRLCGSTSCTNTVTSGQVTISKAIPGIVFPIAAGSYIAIMLDGQGYAKTNTYPFTVRAQSPTTSPPTSASKSPPPVVVSKPPPPPPVGPSSLTFVGKSSPAKYANKENVIISFVDSTPKLGDWIGIWWSKTWDASKQAGKVASAIRTCGSASCTSYPKSGSVTFTSGIAGVGWPLPWGQYRIVMLNFNNVTISPVYSFSVAQ